MAKSLRAVGVDETAPKKDLSVLEAASRGDQRALLVATRTRIAKAMDSPGCPARDLAALTKRLTDIAKEIDAIDVKAAQEEGEDAPAGDEEWDASAI